jgi:hypothetical protein
MPAVAIYALRPQYLETVAGLEPAPLQMRVGLLSVTDARLVERREGNAGRARPDGKR